MNIDYSKKFVINLSRSNLIEINKYKRCELHKSEKLIPQTQINGSFIEYELKIQF